MKAGLAQSETAVVVGFSQRALWVMFVSCLWARIVCVIRLVKLWGHFDLRVTWSRGPFSKDLSECYVLRDRLGSLFCPRGWSDARPRGEGGRPPGGSAVIGPGVSKMMSWIWISWSWKCL